MSQANAASSSVQAGPTVDSEQKWRVALRMFQKTHDNLAALRQQVEDTVIVAKTDTDDEGSITAYHFKTGAIHRLLAEARKGDGPATPDSEFLRTAAASPVRGSSVKIEER